MSEDKEKLRQKEGGQIEQPKDKKQLEATDKQAPAVDAQPEAEKKQGKTKKLQKKKSKQKRVVEEGIVYILATFNNTLVTITDKKGNTVCWSSCGAIGFKGSKKSTPFAAQLTASAAAEKAKGMGVKKVEIYVKGPGSGRESAIRAIQAAGLQISAIKDITGLPHNGCRAPKRRRV